MADTTSSSSSASKAISFTPGETKLLLSILLHLQGELKSDFAAVAQDCNLKDSSVAKMRWSQIRRKKILPTSESPSASASASASASRGSIGGRGGIEKESVIRTKASVSKTKAKPKSMARNRVKAIAAKDENEDEDEVEGEECDRQAKKEGETSFIKEEEIEDADVPEV